MLKFKVIWIDQESEGELCAGCKEEISGKKWVMMLDFEDPVNFPPYPINVIFCDECKNEYDGNKKNSV